MNKLDAQLISVLHQLPPDLKTVLAAFARRELEKMKDNPKEDAAK